MPGAGVTLFPASPNCRLSSLARQAPPLSTPYELARMRTPAHVPKAISFHHATVSSRLFGGSTWCIKHTRAYQGRVISGPEAGAMSRVPRGSGQGWP